MSSNAQSANFALLFELCLESGYPVNAKHAELERRSVYQLRLKAVEMLRSRTLSWLRVMEMTSVWNVYGTGMNTVLWKRV